MKTNKPVTEGVDGCNGKCLVFGDMPYKPDIYRCVHSSDSDYFWDSVESTVDETSNVLLAIFVELSPKQF